MYEGESKTLVVGSVWSTQKTIAKLQSGWRQQSPCWRQPYQNRMAAKTKIRRNTTRNFVEGQSLDENEVAVANVKSAGRGANMHAVIVFVIATTESAIAARAMAAAGPTQVAVVSVTAGITGEVATTETAIAARVMAVAGPTEGAAVSVTTGMRRGEVAAIAIVARAMAAAGPTEVAAVSVTAGMRIGEAAAAGGVGAAAGIPTEVASAVGFEAAGIPTDVAAIVGVGAGGIPQVVVAAVAAGVDATADDEAPSESGVGVVTAEATDEWENNCTHR